MMKESIVTCILTKVGQKYFEPSRETKNFPNYGYEPHSITSQGVIIDKIK